ncbi:TolC family protein [Robiginitalea sp. SC105]|nr:TolC family protein [Robiginitalea sp. SC105]
MVAAQDTGVLTLEACIARALENNLDLAGNRLDAETARVNYRLAAGDMLPGVNGDFDLGINDGRSIDPFTNDYINEKLTFSNIGLSLNALVFNGFSQYNTMRRQRLNLKAADLEYEAARQALALEVTLAFLQALNARELVRLTEGRIGSTEVQVVRLQTLFDQETGNPAAFRDLQGQYASDRATLAQARNALTAAVLELERLMNSEAPIDPERLGILMDFEPYGLSAGEVYADALANLDAIEARRLRLEAARKGVAAARGRFTPEISFFAGLRSNYSSLANLFTETGTEITETGDFVTIAGQDYPVLSESILFQADPISYRDQLDNNLSTFYGMSARIPLFNGLRAHNNLKQQKIERTRAEVALDQSELRFRQAIRGAHADMETALERYRVLEEQVAAYEESFRINEIRFNNGVSNSTEYIVSKNNLDNARINLANVQYEYLLRVRVLEYYRGNAQW